MCGKEFTNGLVLETHWIKHEVNLPEHASSPSPAAPTPPASPNPNNLNNLNPDKLNPFRLRPYQCNVRFA